MSDKKNKNKNKKTNKFDLEECPITLETFNNIKMFGIVPTSGIIYSYYEIHDWLKTRNNDPATVIELPDKILLKTNDKQYAKLIRQVIKNKLIDINKLNKGDQFLLNLPHKYKKLQEFKIDFESDNWIKFEDNMRTTFTDPDDTIIKLKRPDNTGICHQYLDLSGLICADMNYKNFNFSFANLKNMELYNCDLSNCIFIGCNLDNVFFDNCTFGINPCFYKATGVPIFKNCKMLIDEKIEAKTKQEMEDFLFDQLLSSFRVVGFDSDLKNDQLVQNEFDNYEDNYDEDDDN